MSPVLRTHRSGRDSPSEILPRRPSWSLRGFGGGGANRRRNRMEDSLKFTQTQLRLLAAASQRDDRALERQSNLTGGVAGKVVAKLLAEGLVEEIQSRGSFDEATAADEPPKKPPARSAAGRLVMKPLTVARAPPLQAGARSVSLPSAPGLAAAGDWVQAILFYRSDSVR
jgi:hypothetical protein